MTFTTQLRVKELLRKRGWTTKVLAEKTGMSESYLTHIKNGTRRWNEDALRKLAKAFETIPVNLFAQRRSMIDNIEESIELPKTSDAQLNLKIVPVVGEIPESPSAYNNQIVQIRSGYKDVFVPVFNIKDNSMFCFSVENNLMAPTFTKDDLLIVSLVFDVKSTDIVAVEYGNKEVVRSIMQITLTDEFVVLQPVNHKHSSIALIKGKDHFRIIGKVVYRYQKMS